MIRLTLQQILDFYDVPQLFVAKDMMNVNYLCVLFCQQDGFHYLGVQLTELRLSSFCSGQVDLRKLYEQPEQDNTLYEVLVEKEQIHAVRLLSQEQLTEDMLPAPGYYFDTNTTEADSATDIFQLSIPPQDRNFMADMVKRMGWTMSHLSHATRRIAVL